MRVNFYSIRRSDSARYSRVFSSNSVWYGFVEAWCTERWRCAWQSESRYAIVYLRVAHRQPHNRETSVIPIQFTRDCHVSQLNNSTESKVHRVHERQADMLLEVKSSASAYDRKWNSRLTRTSLYLGHQ